MIKMDVVEGEDVEMEKIGEPVLWDTVPAAESPPPVRAAAGIAAGKPGAAPTTSSTSRFAPSNFPQQSSQPSLSSPLASASPLVAARATPIEGLNPYSNKWLIKARVVSKSEMRTFSNDRGQSSVFSVDLCDDSAEIRATAWREVADRLYPSIGVGKTYLISRGQLKVANKKFSTLNNSYEITLTYDTQLQVCADEPDSKPKIHYRFVQISDMESRPANAIVDVLGVVTNVSGCTSITTKLGKELAKRTMVVSDDSGKAIELTLWGSNAESFPDDADTQVVAFKGLRVTEWNQRSLGSSQGSLFEVSPPEVEGVERLKTWWEGQLLRASNPSPLPSSALLAPPRSDWPLTAVFGSLIASRWRLHRHRLALAGHARRGRRQQDRQGGAHDHSRLRRGGLCGGDQRDDLGLDARLHLQAPRGPLQYRIGEADVVRLVPQVR